MVQYLGLGEWGSVCKSVFFPTAAPPNLTVDGAMRVVEGVRDWRDLALYLWVPDSKHGESVKDVITYWMTTDPFPSWRRLICALYESGEKGNADSVRHYAEPLAGTSFELPHPLFIYFHKIFMSYFRTGM